MADSHIFTSSVLGWNFGVLRASSLSILNFAIELKFQGQPGHGYLLVDNLSDSAMINVQLFVDLLNPHPTPASTSLPWHVFKTYMLCWPDSPASGWIQYPTHTYQDSRPRLMSAAASCQPQNTESIPWSMHLLSCVGPCCQGLRWKYIYKKNSTLCPPALLYPHRAPDNVCCSISPSTGMFISPTDPLL